MEKLLFIDSTVRPQNISRTYKLAQKVLEENVKTGLYETETVRLLDNEEKLLPLNYKRLEERTALVQKKAYDNSLFSFARQFADADLIVIAAPFWDMSFPAVLKCYFEQVSVSGVTFYYNEKNEAVGLCKAKKIIYVTTAGGKRYYNGGFEYVKGLCENLFGIKSFEEVYEENLDAL